MPVSQAKLAPAPLPTVQAPAIAPAQPPPPAPAGQSPLSERSNSTSAPPHPAPSTPTPDRVRGRLSPHRGEVTLGQGIATGSPLPVGERSRAKLAGEGDPPSRISFATRSDARADAPQDAPPLPSEPQPAWDPILQGAD